MVARVEGVELEAFEYDDASGTVRTQYDQAKTSASRCVIATLAAATDVDSLELEPLYHSIDPDALESLVRVRNGSVGDTHVSFTHEGHAVTVHSYGVVTVTPKSTARQSPSQGFAADD